MTYNKQIHTIQKKKKLLPDINFGISAIPDFYSWQVWCLSSSYTINKCPRNKSISLCVMEVVATVDRFIYIL